MAKKTYVLKKACPNIGKEEGDYYNDEYGKNYTALMQRGLIEVEKDYSPNDNMEGKLLNHFIARTMAKKDYKHVDTDYDNGECRVVFEDIEDSNITITIMYQD